MNDLITWLRAQLDDDERDAPMRHRLTCDYAPSDGAEPCSCALPDLTLAEIDAKRRIVAMHLPEPMGYIEADRCPQCRLPWPCETMRLLALPYADREGYRDEWRP
jgi:Family of unknown function (DUF6221)